MDLLPFLSAISTGNPTFDHAAKVVGFILIGFSILLNILVAVYPASKAWTWVQVSLAVLTNIREVVAKLAKPPGAVSLPPPKLEVLPGAKAEPFPPEPPTVPDRPTTPPAAE
jgi:hypothetical protein